MINRHKFTKYRFALLALVFTLIITSALSINVVSTFGYVDALGNVISSTVNGDLLTLVVDNGAEPGDDILELQACENNILRVNYRPNGVTPSPDTPMLDPNKTWSAVGANINTAGDPIIITTNEMKVEIAKNPCRMTIKKADGTTLLWEPSTGGVFYDGVRFKHNNSHNIYGIRSFNCFEDNGDILRNDNSHAAHAGEQGDSGGPFMWSTAGYGVLVDSDGGYPYTESTSGKLEFYYGGTPTEGRRYTKTDVEYFVMLGQPEDIMESVAQITGTSPMLPKWSMGFSNFEWDIDQSEMVNIVDTYRAKNIPIDSYALDYDWKCYGENNYGEFRWNTGNFPDAATTSFKNMMDQKGIKMIGITKPRIVTKDFNNQTTVQAIDAENNGYWYPGHYAYQDYFIPVEVRSIDPYSAGARSWFWNHSKDAFDKGIVGWWNDETDKVSSGGAQYWFGNFMTTHMSQALFEGQKSYSPQRVWQTARTFYPGAQRYATTLWSGDIAVQYYKGEKVSWAAGMQEQRPVMLSAINLGQPKWGMDGGGFNQNDGTINNPSPELYTKWVQFGAMTPVFRVHGNNMHQRQPWYYGTTAEEVAKHAIQLRYKLLPYIYAYERTAYERGVGLVRPLIFDYPTDNNVSNYTDAWMFGEWMLVSPVVEEAQTLKDVYLPAGTWIDYFRGNTYTGGQTIQYPVNAQSWTDIPMFVKKGAIIPSQKVLDYVGQSNISVVDVDVFPDTTETSFTYYDDDGDTYNYEGTQYIKQVMTAKDNGGNNISFTIQGKTGSYTPALQYYIVKIHGNAGTDAKINSASVTKYGDLSSLKVATGEGWATGKDIYGEVTYVKVAACSTSAKNIVVSGDDTVSASTVKLEAEEASLSGNSTSTKASVNNNHTGYSGTGFVDGYNNDGAATTFYVNAKTSGDYNINLRYANATGLTKSLGIYVNGTRIKDTSLESLANWDTWADKTETLPLTAGNNIVTYKYESDAGDSGNVNIDYIMVPFNPVVAKYEAESAKLSGGASINKNHWFYTGAGFVDGLTSVGAQTSFEVYVPAAGMYNVSLRYANGTGSNKQISVYTNGSHVADAILPSLGIDWNKWSDNVNALSLNAGKNEITYKYDTSDSGNVNLDRILVSSSSVGIPVSEKNLLDNGSFERPTNYTSNWYEWHPTGQELAYGIDSGSTVTPPEAPYEGGKRVYLWLGSAYKQSIHQTISVPTNNAHYTFEARVRLKNTNPYIARAEISNFGASTIYYNLVNDGQWHYIKVKDIYVTSGQIDIGFYVDSPGGTTLHIDDVRVIKQ